MAIILTLTNADIVGRLNSLAGIVTRATSGTVSTIVRSIDDSEDDQFNNFYICFLNGANKGLDRIVSDYVASTGTFSLDEVLPNTPDNKSEFALVEVGFLGKMEEAFAFITDEIRNSGFEIDRFLNTSQLKEIHLYKTLDLICLDLYRDKTDEDMYWTNHEFYLKQFEQTFTNLKADYDLDEDGTISEHEEVKNFGFGVIRK